MATAYLIDVLGSGSVRLLEDGDNVVDAFPLTANDGPGPIPAAEAVLAANGWRLTTEWSQVSGGVTGGEWIAKADRAESVGPASE